jgi:MtN3 and saliva related transmembrane protein
MITELIGWGSAVILLLTIGRQVYTQWRTRSTQGLSKWLFIGQLAASTGFIVYSWLLGNWVFLVTNVLMLATAAAGQWIYLGNVRREKKRKKLKIVAMPELFRNSGATE